MIEYVLEHEVLLRIAVVSSLLESTQWGRLSNKRGNPLKSASPWLETNIWKKQNKPVEQNKHLDAPLHAADRMALHAAASSCPIFFSPVQFQYPLLP